MIHYEYGRCCEISEPVWPFKPFNSCSMMRRPSAAILSDPHTAKVKKKTHSEWDERLLLTHDKVDSCRWWFLLQYNGKWGQWLQKWWPFSAHSPSIRLPHSFNSDTHLRLNFFWAQNIYIPTLPKSTHIVLVPQHTNWRWKNKMIIEGKREGKTTSPSLQDGLILGWEEQLKLFWASSQKQREALNQADWRSKWDPKPFFDCRRSWRS